MAEASMITPSATTDRGDNVLDVSQLEAAFFTHRGVVRAVNGISFQLKAGETLGIVGESGSGKSVTALSILQCLPYPGRILGGEVKFLGEDLRAKSERQMQHILGRSMSVVPQDPTASLNPLMRIGEHLLEVLSAHTDLGKDEAKQRSIELLDIVGIPDPEQRFRDYPHQLSGGMRQRVMIAMAIACDPVLLIADEPTTSLDATVQAQILELIRALTLDLDSATIMITHNLGIVAGLCDTVAVMYAGRIVEMAPTDELFERPRHPYTLSLLQCVPRLDRIGIDDLRSIPGQPPDLIYIPPGCAFAPRCPLASERCEVDVPALTSQGPNHVAACWNVADIQRMIR